MALTTRSSPWPMLTHINWLLKSRKRLPSGVQKYTPFARATGNRIDRALGRPLEDGVFLGECDDFVASHDGQIVSGCQLSVAVLR